MEHESMMDVIVIGAGLCGLTAAYYLSQSGRSVLLLEQSDRVGGVIQSIREKGFLMEAGPNTFVSSAQAVLSLCEAVGLKPEAASSLAKKRYLYLKDQLIPLPSNPIEFLFSPVLSAPAKWRLLQEPWQPSFGQEDETVAEFTRRRLGQEVLEHLVGPFVSGIYAGDPEILSLPAAMPRLREWERESGSLVLGAVKAMQAKKKERAGKPKAPYNLYSFSEGMEALPKAIAGALPFEHVRLNQSVQVIDRELEGFKVVLEDNETIWSRALVLATPAEVTGTLLTRMAPAAQEQLAQIPYAPMGAVHLGFNRNQIPHPLDGFGFLAPRVSGLPLLGSIWSSSLYPERAPEGQVLFSCFLGGATEPNVAYWQEAEFITHALAGLQRMFHTPELDPTFSQVSYYSQALPQYILGHGQRIERVEQAIALVPGLSLTGNYLYGASLNDCVKDGYRTAQAVERYLNCSRRDL